MDKRFLLLQINDAAFPIGSYTHSYGLETYIQKNLVNNAKDVYEYIKANAETNFLYTELLAAYKAYEFAEENQLSKIFELEEIIDASKLPQEIRTASEKLGSRFIKTVNSLEVKYKSNIFNEYIKKENKGTRIHSSAYGVFSFAAGIDKARAMEGYLYAYVSASIINAVKLIPLSQNEGQRILYKCYKFFDEIIDMLQNLEMKDLCLSTPGFDIRCMQHEALYSRLYMS